MRVVESGPRTLLDGRYELGECVGVGGMARVYRATDLSLGRTVAIKLMRDDGDLLAAPARVRTEMTALASLSSPALVKLLDGQIEPGRPRYLVMEFVDGETLADRLRRGALPADEAAHVAKELAGALHVVHQAGIVHRDVKPANVLVAPNRAGDGRPQIKLTDFGVAQLMDSARVTSTGTVVGTGAYLAPEQVRGEVAGPPADIYALGLLLLEALTGAHAYGHLSGIGAVMARLIDAPAVPTRVGPHWARLLTRMVSSDPAQRPSALEVVAAVHAMQTGAIAVARTAGAQVTQETVIPPLPETRPIPVPAPAAPAALGIDLDVPPKPSMPVTRTVPLAARGARRRPAVAARRTRMTVGALAAAAVAVAAIGVGLSFDANAVAPAHDPLSGLSAVTDATTVDEPEVVTADTTSVAFDTATTEPGERAAGPAAKDQQKQSAAERESAKVQREAERETKKQQREDAKQQPADGKQKRKNG